MAWFIRMTDFFFFVVLFLLLIINCLFVCFIVLQANLEISKAQAVILQVLGQKLQVQFSMTRV